MAAPDRFRLRLAPAKCGPGLRITIALVGLLQTLAIIAALAWMHRP